MNNDKVSRNSNIELLRIVSMLIIIFHHSFVHSQLNINDDNIYNSLNYTILYIVNILGKGVNNFFILITGYYLINKKIRKKAIFKLIIKTFLYSIIIFIIYILIEGDFNVEFFWESIFPISTSSYWFLTYYLLLYISIPFVNSLVKNLKRKELVLLILLLTVIFSFLPNNYGWFVTVYLVGGYFRLYHVKISKHFLRNSILVSIYLLIILRLLVGDNIAYFNNFIMLTFIVSLFYIVISKKEKFNSNINYVSKSILSVYIIHDNFIVREYLYRLLNLNHFIDKWYFWIYEFIIVILIFSICLILDKLMEKIFELLKGIKSVKKFKQSEIA